MNRFEFDNANGGLFIRHSAFPECIIECVQLEAITMWSEVAGYDDIFDIFNFKKSNERLAYMLIVYGDDDVPDDEVVYYRRMLRKAWKWLLYGWLIPNNHLPSQPRFISLNQYDQEDDTRDYSIERVDGEIFITRRVYPILRARLSGNQIDIIEIMEDVPPDPLLIASILRSMGDWYAQIKF